MQQTDDVIVVSLDIDANENEEAVREHIERNGFEGYFAISPSVLTQALVDEYGTFIITPPLSPKILVNTDQTEAEALERGVKSAEELQALADEAR
ncbi:MAG: hypothetical protein RQ731_09960 [Anaerosomatales bacterium]|nr:hypothetical protein [Anaerosomatales bacterium]MDT8435065.1 hypothetical protein [Anaerosomatales bacterium]